MLSLVELLKLWVDKARCSPWHRTLTSLTLLLKMKRALKKMTRKACGESTSPTLIQCCLSAAWNINKIRSRFKNLFFAVEMRAPGSQTYSAIIKTVTWRRQSGRHLRSELISIDANSPSMKILESWRLQWQVLRSMPRLQKRKMILAHRRRHQWLISYRA